MKNTPPQLLMKRGSRVTKKELVALRRDIHKHPELGFQEARTSKLVQLHLKELGLKPKVLAGTGVTTTLGRAGGKTLMLRCDIDALPMTEENKTSYTSANVGVMHACGHDLHTAILLGTAKNLAHQGPAKGRVKLNFQPAEEGLNGAGAMIDAGIMKNPKVDAVLGYHIWNDLPVGKIGVVTGPAMAAVDRFKVVIDGKGGHAAYPQGSVDPILAGSHIVTALQSIVSRNLNPLDAAVVTVARLEAGTTFNIIPPRAVMEGTVRTFSKAAGKMVPKRFKEIVRGVAKSLGCGVEIEYVREHSPLVNDARMSDFMREVAREVVGKRNVVDAEPSMGGEDHAAYQEIVPGCYVFIGAAPKTGEAFPHHHPCFNPSEDVLEIGAELMSRAAVMWLGRN